MLRLAIKESAKATLQSAIFLTSTYMFFGNGREVVRANEGTLNPVKTHIPIDLTPSTTPKP